MLVSELVRVGSPWGALIGERWLCDKGKELEYWRVEKVDSVIVLPLQRDRIFCVAPTYSPGIGRATLDFPCGRLPEGKSPQDTVPFLPQRELGAPQQAIARIEPRACDTLMPCIQDVRAETAHPKIRCKTSIALGGDSCCGRSNPLRPFPVGPANAS